MDPVQINATVLTYADSNYTLTTIKCIHETENIGFLKSKEVKLVAYKGEVRNNKNSGR